MDSSIEKLINDGLTTREKAEAAWMYWDMNADDSKTEQDLENIIFEGLIELDLRQSESRGISRMAIEAFNASSKFKTTAKFLEYATDEIYLKMIALLRNGSWEV